MSNAKKISKNLREVSVALFISHVNLRWRVGLTETQQVEVVNILKGANYQTAADFEGVTPDQFQDLGLTREVARVIAAFFYWRDKPKPKKKKSKEAGEDQKSDDTETLSTSDASPAKSNGTSSGNKPQTSHGEIQQLSEQALAQKQQIHDLEAREKTNKRLIEDLQSELRAQKEALLAQEEANQAKDSELETLRSEVAKLEGELQSTGPQVSNGISASPDVQAELNKKDAEIQRLTKLTMKMMKEQKKQGSKKGTVGKSDLDIVSRKHFEEKVKNLEAEVTTLKAQLTEAKEGVSLSEDSEALEELRKELSKAHRHAEALERELEEAAHKAAEQLQTVKTLEKSLEEAEGRSSNVNKDKSSRDASHVELLEKKQRELDAMAQELDQHSHDLIEWAEGAAAVAAAAGVLSPESPADMQKLAEAVEDRLKQTPKEKSKSDDTIQIASIKRESETYKDRARNFESKLKASEENLAKTNADFANFRKENTTKVSSLTATNRELEAKISELQTLLSESKREVAQAKAAVAEIKREQPKAKQAHQSPRAQMPHTTLVSSVVAVAPSHTDHATSIQKNNGNKPAMPSRKAPSAPTHSPPPRPNISNKTPGTSTAAKSPPKSPIPVFKAEPEDDLPPPPAGYDKSKALPVLAPISFDSFPEDEDPPPPPAEAPPVVGNTYHVSKNVPSASSSLSGKVSTKVGSTSSPVAKNIASQDARVPQTSAAHPLNLSNASKASSYSSSYRKNFSLPQENSDIQKDSQKANNSNSVTSTRASSILADSSDDGDGFCKFPGCSAVIFTKGLCPIHWKSRPRKKI